MRGIIVSSGENTTRPIDERIGKLEEIVNAVAQNQSRQERASAEFREETRNDIRKITDSVNQMGKMSWPTILSVITTSIVVGGILIGFIEMRVSNVNDTIKGIQADAAEHARLKGHPAMVEHAAANTVEMGFLRDSIAAMTADLGKVEGKTESMIAEFRDRLDRDVAMMIAPTERRLETVEGMYTSLDTRARGLETSDWVSADEAQAIRDRLSSLESDTRAWFARKETP